jgi:hypothetical protein
MAKALDCVEVVESSNQIFEHIIIMTKIIKNHDDDVARNNN